LFAIDDAPVRPEHEGAENFTLQTSDCWWPAWWNHQRLWLTEQVFANLFIAQAVLEFTGAANRAAACFLALRAVGVIIGAGLVLAIGPGAQPAAIPHPLALVAFQQACWLLRRPSLAGRVEAQALVVVGYQPFDDHRPAQAASTSSRRINGVRSPSIHPAIAKWRPSGALVERVSQVEVEFTGCRCMPLPGLCPSVAG
jgi:hypothetical protein